MKCDRTPPLDNVTMMCLRFRVVDASHIDLERFRRLACFAAEAEADGCAYTLDPRIVIAIIDELASWRASPGSRIYPPEVVQS